MQPGAETYGRAPSGPSIGLEWSPWRRRGAKIGPTKRGKGTKWMVLVDGAGTPLGAYLDAASPAEVTLLEKTPASQPIRGKPDRLIADRGYDQQRRPAIPQAPTHPADHPRPLQ